MPSGFILLAAGHYDPQERTIHGSAGTVPLTPIEAKLLDYLLANAGRTLPHAELMRSVWGYREGTQSRTLYATIDRLRKKIELDPAHPRHLHNRARQGYRFELSPTAASPDLVGREAELDALLGAVRPGSLLTLTGTGGAGKTRLAEELAALLRARGWGATVCALAEARTLQDLTLTLARHLDIPLTTLDPLEQIGRALAGRDPFLLVLDNLEQLLEPARRALRCWRALAPRLCVLTTSRVPLHLDDERLLVVPPLPTPPEGASAEEIARTPAVRLLLQRARARPELDADKAALARIVRAVDGVPLALELAAARLRLMSASALAARLERDLELLADPERALRHGTLAALISWSWELLAPEERRALEQCALFVAPFDAELAERVLDPPQEGSVLVVLDTLLEHNLIRVLPSEPPRLDLFEPVREFLRARGLPPAALATRYVQACAERGPPGSASVLDLPDAERRWRRLRDDLPHLLHAARLGAPLAPDEAALAALHACQVLLHQGLPDQAAELLGPLFDRGLVSLKLRVALGLALAQAQHGATRPAEATATLQLVRPDTASDHAQIGLLRASILWRQGAIEGSEAAFRQALEDARRADDLVLLARVRMELGSLLITRGDGDAAAEQLEEALLTLPPGLGLWVRLQTQGYLLRLTILRGQHARALDLGDDLLARARALGLSRLVPGCLELLGYVRAVLGDTEGARAALLASLAESERQGAAREMWIIRRGIGWFELQQGDLERAREHLRRAIQGARTARDEAREALGLWRMAEVERRAGDLRAATRLLEQAEQRWRPPAFPVERARAGLVWGHLHLAQGELIAAKQRVEAARALLGQRPPGWEPELERETQALEEALASL